MDKNNVWYFFFTENWPLIWENVEKSEPGGIYGKGEAIWPPSGRKNKQLFFDLTSQYSEFSADSE